MIDPKAKLGSIATSATLWRSLSQVAAMRKPPQRGLGERTTSTMVAKVTRRLLEIGDIVEAWEVAQVRRRSIRGGSAMEWFSRKTSIGGSEISNWVLVLAAVVIVWLIFSFAAR